MNKIVLNGLKDAFRLYPELLKRAAGGLATLFVIDFGVEQYLNEQMRVAAHLGYTNIVAALILITWSFVLSLIIALYVPLRLFDIDQKQPNTPLWRFADDTAMPLTLESLRVLAHCFLWSLLVIIPGVIKYIQYLFVPFVVMFDERYARGEVDALKESAQLLKGHALKVFLFILVLFAAGMSVDVVTNSFSLTQHPVIVMSLALISFLLEIFGTSALFLIYLNRKRGPHGTVF